MAEISAERRLQETWYLRDAMAVAGQLIYDNKDSQMFRGNLLHNLVSTTFYVIRYISMTSVAPARECICRSVIALQIGIPVPFLI